jgi:arginine utilization protein RocB
VTKRKNARDQRLRRLLDVLAAYRRHYGSTTQREEAAADLGMNLEDFRELLEKARRSGFDIEAAPDPNR